MRASGAAVLTLVVDVGQIIFITFAKFGVQKRNKNRMSIGQITEENIYCPLCLQ